MKLRRIAWNDNAGKSRTYPGWVTSPDPPTKVLTASRYRGLSQARRGASLLFIQVLPSTESWQVPAEEQRYTDLGLTLMPYPAAYFGNFMARAISDGREDDATQVLLLIEKCRLRIVL